MKTQWFLKKPMGFLGFLQVNDLNLNAVADDVPALLFDAGDRNSAAFEEHFVLGVQARYSVTPSRLALVPRRLSAMNLSP